MTRSSHVVLTTSRLREHSFMFRDGTERSMTRSFCHTALARSLLVCALTMVPLGMGAFADFDGSSSGLAPHSGAPSLTPIAAKLGAAATESKFQMAQQDGRGRVCRNWHYVCQMNGSGVIGYSCCGCGFCGWWSAN